MSSVHKYQWKLIRKRVLERDGRTCNHCGQSEGKMEVDHILPRHRGGDDSMGNLQTLCQRCHIKKSKQDSVFLRKKKHPSYPYPFSLPKVRFNPDRSHTKAVEGDSEAFGLG
jgi:5-methylcytosine-specific restriction endonuclease McrA